MPDSPVTFPESPTTSLAPTHTLAEACRDVNAADQEGSQVSGGDGYDSFFDYSGSSYCYGSATEHANIECMQDTELVPSSAADGSPTSGMLSAAVARDTPSTDSSIHPSSLSRSARRARLPNTTTTGASGSTSPVYKGGVIPTTTYGTSGETSGRVIDSVPNQSPPPFGPNVSQYIWLSIKRVVC